MTASSTPRLKLVPQTRTHADALFPVLNDDTLYTHIGGNPLTIEALRERYTRLESGRSPDGTQRWFNWVVAVDEALVGTVQATVTGSEAFLAWVIGTAWHGHGYATEAAQAMLEALRSEGVTTFKALAHPENLASQRVAQKVGMTLTKTIIDDEELWQIGFA